MGGARGDWHVGANRDPRMSVKSLNPSVLGPLAPADLSRS